MSNRNTYPDIDNEAYRLFDYPNLTGTPERRLLLAVIERAILDYVGNDEKEANDATGWLFDDSDETPPLEFTFPWICNELDLQTTEIQEKIRSMPKRGESRVAPWYMVRAG